MDMLHRHNAPLTDRAWALIDDAVARVLRARLTGRRVVDVDGPHGIDHAAVGLGRLEIGADAGPIGWGVHRVQPLLEARARFALDLWELDNVERGARDVDLDAAEDAARAIADFEDRAVFNGFAAAAITGLTELRAHAPATLALEVDPFAGAIATALLTLRDRAVGGPYALVLGHEAYQFLNSQSCGYPLRRQIAGIFDGEIHYSPVVKGGVLLSQRGGDFALTLGQDLAVGFESHAERQVHLFVTESFTFRVIEPKAAVVLAGADAKAAEQR